MERPGVEQLRAVLPHICATYRVPILSLFVEDLGILSSVSKSKHPFANALLVLSTQIYQDLLNEFPKESTPPMPCDIFQHFLHLQNTMITTHLMVMTCVMDLIDEDKLVLLMDTPVSVEKLAKVNGCETIEELALHIADVMGWTVVNEDQPLADLEVGMEVSIEEATELVKGFSKQLREANESDDKEEEDISFFDEEA